MEDRDLQDWHSGEALWESSFGDQRELLDEVACPAAEEAVSEEGTGRYAAFSAKAEAHILSKTGQIWESKGFHVGRGRARTWRRTAAAPRSPRPELYYCREANDVAHLELLLPHLRSIVQELTKARRKRGAGDREEEQHLLRRMEPLLKISIETIREDQSRKFQHEVATAVETLEMLGDELSGGMPVPVVKLAVAGNRLEAAVDRAVNRAGRHRAADFRSWIQQHVGGGAGALHRFTNRDNQLGTALDEIALEGGTLCTSEELMRHRVQTWTEL